MISLLKKIIPLNVKTWISHKWHLFYMVRHESEISELGRQEINYSLSYALINKKYSTFLSTCIKRRAGYSSTPLTRIIWWCWLQGEEQAPMLCKACLASLRRNLPQFEVKVVTEHNMFSYVHFPQHIIEKYKAGSISRTHFSDILRTSLLVEHGGVWIDSTVYCTGYAFPIFDYFFFVYQNWKFNIPQAMEASSWLISARKGDPILCGVRDLLYKYWADKDCLCHYYLYHFFFKMVTEQYKEEWMAVPRYSNIPPHIMQFELFRPYSEERFRQLSAMSDFHKLTWKSTSNDKQLEGTLYMHLCQSK